MDGRAYDTKLVLGLVVLGSQLLQSDAERCSRGDVSMLPWLWTGEVWMMQQLKGYLEVGS
jgi:hypothetical protein